MNKQQELINEYKDGEFDAWLLDNKENLSADYLEMHQKDFSDYCWEQWREENE